LYDTLLQRPSQADLLRTADDLVERLNATWAPHFQVREQQRESDKDFVLWTKGTRYLDLVTDLRDVRAYMLQCAGDIQGVLVLQDEGETSRIVEGATVLTVRYVATAPWNRPLQNRPGRFRGVGTVLLVQSVSESQALGYEGRIGLHSLQGSDGFYRRLGFRDFGPDPANRGMTYFELDPVASLRLIDWANHRAAECAMAETSCRHAGS
jgi:hypothetical protein